MQSNSKVIRNKLSLLNLAQELNNLSEAFKMKGYLKDTFYRYRDLVDEGGEIALHDKSRPKPNLKNRIDDSTETIIVQMDLIYLLMAKLEPAMDFVRMESLSPAGVRGIWQRHGLEVFQKRLKSL